MSNIVHKIKDAVSGDKSHQSTAPEATYGPNSSSRTTGNTMDSGVDSGRGTMGTGRMAGQGEYGSGGYGTGTAGATGTAGYSTGTAGPHQSNMANKMDPRVDSDRDNSHTMGTGRTAGHGEYGSSGGYGTSTSGPHQSNMANKMDPRVDSDRGTTGIGRTAGHGEFGSTGGTGTRTTGLGSSTGATGAGAGTGATGTGSGMSGVTGSHGAPAGTHGPHGSRAANVMDPRVDSDRDGRGALGTGPGPAKSTAGPHKSDMANKMDPRVDSDLDGSRTMGGNKTYQSGNMPTAHRDPTDAAQVPPSVLQQHIGGPVVEHQDAGHHRERRNSVKTHQETFSGI